MASPYFDDLLDAQGGSSIRGTPKAPVHRWVTCAGCTPISRANRDFLAYLRNAKTFYDKAAGAS